MIEVFVILFFLIAIAFLVWGFVDFSYDNKLFANLLAFFFFSALSYNSLNVEHIACECSVDIADCFCLPWIYHDTTLARTCLLMSIIAGLRFFHSVSLVLEARSKIKKKQEDDE